MTYQTSISGITHINSKRKRRSSCIFYSPSAISLTIYQFSILNASFFQLVAVHIPSAILHRLKARLCTYARSPLKSSISRSLSVVSDFSVAKPG